MSKRKGPFSPPLKPVPDRPQGLVSFFMKGKNGMLGRSTETGALMPSINLHRGLFRLWVVASLVWLVIVGVSVQDEIRRDVSTLTTESRRPPRNLLAGQERQSLRKEELSELPAGFVPVSPKGQVAPIPFRFSTTQRAQRNLVAAVSGLLLPPILAFALGWAALWIMKGFRR